MKIGTFIYSSNSVEALKDMLQEFFIVFNIPLTPDELFYYGVFCKENTYANYKYWDEAPVTMEIPEVFTGTCHSQEDRIEFVHYTINKVMTGEIEKPSWMLYVEMEENCNNYETAPSNYLYLIPKESKYKKLAEKILDFLYSPNLIDYSNQYL